MAGDDRVEQNVERIDSRSGTWKNPEDRLIEGSPKALGIAKVLEAHRDERHIVVLHDYPDPDAISCAFAHQMLSAGFDIEVDIVYDGRISHQQNVALVKLMGIELTPYDESVNVKQYDGAVFVDNQGANASLITQALMDAGVPILVVVDHHEAQEGLSPEFSEVRRAGSVATIYAGYLKDGLVQMERSRREHVMVATSLMHGIITDTNGLVRASAEDLTAAAFLSRFRDADLLEQIMSQARSKQTMEVIRQALGSRLIVESFSLAGIGYLRAEDRDAIPQAADFLLTEENVHTALVYGIVTASGKESMVGSMRTSKITVDPDAFIKEVFGQAAQGRYYGGGKWSAGAFEISVGFLSGGTDAEYLERKWQVYDAQIRQRVFAKIGVEGA
jgi:nanoRNase/pAp phosphatase (c-di-AMP/oligoRNAs hydrolase)